MTTRIFVTHQFEALHHYKNAPDAVSFLRTPHRHMFHVRVEIEVFHNDREIEFILCKSQVAAYCDKQPLGGSGVADLGTTSCEQIAEGLVTLIVDLYGDRSIRIEVSEDGENGAIVEHDPLPAA